MKKIISALFIAICISSCGNSSTPVPVLPTNIKPVAISKSITSTQGTSLTVTLEASDTDGTITSYQITRFPLNGALANIATNRFVYTPKINFSGADSFAYNAIDNNNTSSNEAIISLNITAISNVKPTAFSKTIIGNEDIPLTITLLGTDTDGNVTKFMINRFPINGTLISASTSSYTYTPKANYNGSDTFSYSAIDNLNGISTAAIITISINPINDLPTFPAATRTITLIENNTLTHLISQATDADSDTITYSITGGVDQALFSINSASRTLFLTSPPDYESPTDANKDNTYTVVISASDGKGGVTQQTIHVMVSDTPNGVGPYISYPHANANLGGHATMTTVVVNTFPNIESTFTATVNSVTINNINATSLGKMRWSTKVPVTFGSNTLSVKINTSTTSLILTQTINNTPISAPSTITLDSKNSRLFAASDQLIFSVNLTTGNSSIVSSTTKGSGNAFQNVNDIALDTTNNRLYVTDGISATVYAVDITTGNRTVISNSTRGIGANLKHPFGIAIDSTNNRLLVTDYQAFSVIAINITSGDRSLLSGSSRGTGSTLLFPTFSVKDITNNRLFVSSYQALSSIDLSTGNRTFLTTSITGTGPIIDDPAGLALDQAGNRLLVLNSKSIIGVDLTTRNREVFASSTTGTGIILKNPVDIIYDSSTQQIYTSDRDLDSIIRIDNKGKRSVFLSSTITTETISGFAASIAYDANAHRLLLAGRSTKTLVAINLNNGKSNVLSSPSKGTGNAFSNISAMATNNSTNQLYVIDDDIYTLMAIDLNTGNRTIIASSVIGTGQPLKEVRDIIVDYSNNRVLGYSGDMLLAIDIATGNRTIIASFGVGTGTTPIRVQGLTLDSVNNRVLVVDSVYKAVIAIDLKTGNRTVISSSTKGTGTYFDFPADIALDSANNRAFVSEPSLNNISAVDLSTGNRTLLASNTVGSGTSFNRVYDVIFDSQNNRIFVTDRNLLTAINIELSSGERAIISK